MRFDSSYDDILECNTVIVLYSRMEAMFIEIPVARRKIARYERLFGRLGRYFAPTISKRISNMINDTEFNYNQVERTKMFVQENCTIEAMIKMQLLFIKRY